MSVSHHSAPLPADLDAIAATARGGDTPVENVENVEAASTDFNQFNDFNGTPSSERIHPIPEDSILADVRDIAREFSEAPDSFAVAAFLALVGGAITPHCWWEFAGKKFCNLYQFVVAPPGVKKSTSFKIAERVGKIALQGDAFHQGNASDSAAFQKWLKQPHRIQLESEGNTCVTAWRGSYAGREIAARMLKLYDGDGWEQTFKNQADADGNGAEQKIECATLSVAIGATPQVCRFDGVDGKSGLRRRFGYYTADDIAREIDWPRLINDEDLDELANHVRRIADLEGKFALTKDAENEWQELQRRVRADVRSTASDASEEAEIRRSELTETPSRVLKLAGIFQVCRWAKIGGDPFTVDASTLSVAIAHQFACLDASRAVDAIAHRSAIDDDAEKILDSIRSEARDPKQIGRWPIEGNAILVNRSDITRRFAANGNRRRITAHYLHTAIMPLVIAKAKGTTESRDGSTVYKIPMEREPSRESREF